MNGTLFVVLIALGLGIAFGKWWEHDRVGGTLDLTEHVDRLETEVEAEQLVNATLRGEIGERRAASMATHPSVACRGNLDGRDVVRALNDYRLRTGRPAL